MILLCGYPQSGNLWLRMFIFNYANVLNHNARKTLTFQQLKDINRHHFRIPQDFKLEPFNEGFPEIYWCHCSWHPIFEKFDKIIHIYRNPYDNMLAYYYFSQHREKSSKLSFNEFVKIAIDQWIGYMKSMRDKVDLMINYDKLPSNTREIIQMIFGEVNEKAYNKALRYSKKDNLMEMAYKKNQQSGMIISTFTGDIFKYWDVGCHKEVMSKELRDYIKMRIESE